MNKASDLFNNPVSSIESIICTIESDYFVYRWFAFLLDQPLLRKNVLNLENTKPLFAKLDMLKLFQRVLYALCAGLLLALMGGYGMESILAGGILIFALMKIYKGKKKNVMSISRKMIEADYENAKLSRNTLYQIIETYSRKYKIPSLIDAQFIQDDLCRKLLISAIIINFIIFIFIYQFDFWKIILVTGSIYLLFFLLINTSFIYKRLK